MSEWESFERESHNSTDAPTRVVPWQIVCEIRMTPEDAQTLFEALDPTKFGLLSEALEFQIKDFKKHGFTIGTLVLGLSE